MTGVNREPRPSPLAVWLLAIRPATLSAALGPVAVGAAAVWHVPGANLLAGLLALCAALLIQITVNLHNDLSDFQKGADTTERLGEARATQKGWLRAADLKRGIGGVLLLALIVTLGLAKLSGWPVLAIAAASIASAFAYTGGPFPLAYNGLGDVFVFLFFGAVAVCGTAFVMTGDVPVMAQWASVPVGSFATAILVVNNIRDRNTDRKASKNTLVVRLGEKFGRAEYAALVTLPFAFTAYAIQREVFPLECGVTFVLSPMFIWAAYTVAKTDGSALNPWLSKTAKLGLVHSILLAGGMAV